jgi:hypothetical protein
MRPIDSGIAVLFPAGAAEANPIQFDTHSYNFALDGGGGGESGVLNSDLGVETFCDNFNNEINIGQDYSANVSTFTTGSDLGYTRFGSNSSWSTLSISDGDPNDATDAAILNGAGALARYQMPAFLVSQYQTNQRSNAYNNGIQVAIWDIFDPSSSLTAPNHANADKALEQAAEWYSNPNSNKSFLSDFRIVSESTVSWTGAGDLRSGGPGTARHGDASGTQPRIAVWMLTGSFSMLACLRRPALAMKGAFREVIVFMGLTKPKRQCTSTRTRYPY